MSDLGVRNVSHAFTTRFPPLVAEVGALNPIRFPAPGLGSGGGQRRRA